MKTKEKTIEKEETGEEYTEKNGKCFLNKIPSFLNVSLVAVFKHHNSHVALYVQLIRSKITPIIAITYRKKTLTLVTHPSYVIRNFTACFFISMMTNTLHICHFISTYFLLLQTD